MKVKTTRFGTLAVNPADRLYFPQGLLGFPQLTSFLLLDHTSGPFRWLQSIDDPDVAFVVLTPTLVEPDYHVRLSASELELLAQERLLQEAQIHEDIAVLAIVNVCNPRSPTLNLLAPVCISARTRRGLQTVQHSAGYSTRHPLRLRDRAQDEEPQSPHPNEPARKVA